MISWRRVVLFSHFQYNDLWDWALAPGFASQLTPLFFLSYFWKFVPMLLGSPDPWRELLLLLLWPLLLPKVFKTWRWENKGYVEQDLFSSSCHRSTDLCRLEGTSRGHLAQTLLEAGLVRAAAELQKSPGMRSQQPLCVTTVCSTLWPLVRSTVTKFGRKSIPPAPFFFFLQILYYFASVKGGFPFAKGKWGGRSVIEVAGHSQTHTTPNTLGGAVCNAISIPDFWRL